MALSISGKDFFSFLAGLMLWWCHAGPVAAYPLDGFENTGIGRLLVQREIQEGKRQGKKRPSGELLPLEKVDLRMLDRQDFKLPAPDPELTAKVRRMLGEEASRYGVALLDLSDPEDPRYAEWNGNQHQNPGSVGKILVALGIFQALADIYPNDIEARRRVLRESIITADIFSVYDHHTVPLWNPDSGEITRRPLREGDKGSMYTYLDWMMSPSSNSAAGMLQKHMILLKHFGKAYPVSREEEERFFRETPRKELGRIFEDAIQSPLARNGLDLKSLRQGSFFTREGKKRVPGASSYATPRSLLEFLLKMEQGKLVDEFSSREIKRLLYITERRIRYASSGVLRDSAVYFKSGSLYSCEEEKGFTCKKYHGNKRNYMNSVAVIESPAGQDHLYYMTTVLSNVLRKNSAQDHRDLARAIHGMLKTDHPLEPVAPGELPLSASYGEGFIGYAAERREMQVRLETQEALLGLGYDIGEIDGVIGASTRRAIREFEKSQGMVVTGQPSEALVSRMRQVGEAQGLMRDDSGDAVVAPPALP